MLISWETIAQSLSGDHDTAIAIEVLDQFRSASVDRLRNLIFAGISLDQQPLFSFIQQ